MEILSSLRGRIGFAGPGRILGRTLPIRGIRIKPRHSADIKDDAERQARFDMLVAYGSMTGNGRVMELHGEHVPVPNKHGVCETCGQNIVYMKGKVRG